MRLSVRLFAVCRERAQKSILDLEFESDSITLDELKARIAQAEPSLAPLLKIVRIAKNQSFAIATDTFSEQDEIAMIPPVSGGSGLDLFEVRTETITLAEVEEAVRHPGAGAVVSFLGTVRDQTKGIDVVALEYEVYQEMAERVLRQIGGEVLQRWPGARVAILHRSGRLEIGEASVVIAVSSPHRAAAFEGCRHAIERLKEDVPIWKKELRKDGSIWVGVGS